MKKIIVLTFAMFTFFGCSEELEFNTPSFQAKKDGNLWESITFRANIDNAGVLTILASDNLETLTLVVNNTEIGSHDISETISSGSLIDIDGIQFSTNNTPDPSIQLYPADGLIELREVNLEAGYVSGEFSFNAFSASGLTSVNINEGVFFRVPLLSVPIASSEDPDIPPCDIATATVATTFLNFSAVMVGDSNYLTLCNAYKTALTTQKNSCGDPTGQIQMTIDGLSCI